MTTAEDLTQKIDLIRRKLQKCHLSADVLADLESDFDSIERHLNQAAEQDEHSVLELRGLGKEIWQGIDVDEYLREERASWR
jgi:hypothetical protein